MVGMVAARVASVLLAAALLALLQAATAQQLQLHEGSRCRNEDANRDGTCRSLFTCPWARDQRRQGLYPQLCSFAGREPIVCCPADNGTEAEAKAKAPTTTAPTTTTAAPTVLASERHRSVASKMCEKYSEYVYQRESVVSLDVKESEKVDSCSVPAEPLIVGGDAAAAREFPHMALVGYGNESDIQYLCGGSIISPDFILTAAHCLITQSGQRARWVLLGDLDISSTQDDAQPQRIEVAEAIRHPDYKPPQKYNDIALLRLKSSAQMTAYVRPACLNTNRTFPAKTKPLATGWGQTDFNDDRSNVLLKVALPLQPHLPCNNTFRNHIDSTLPMAVLDDTQLCAGVLEGGKDTCQGDSGGPLSIFTASAPYYCMHHVLGITSFGILCGFRNTPALYTRVSAYVPWIESIVWPEQH